ncbi:MAG: hypothetical protein AAB592_02795 [Patescibacteria group bacterium]
MRRFKKFAILSGVMFVFAASVTVSFAGDSSEKSQKVKCNPNWSVALKGTFDAGWDSAVTLSSGTVGKLISMAEDGCDLKINMKFANAVGQGPYPSLTFPCDVIEADSVSLTCFSPIRYSQYGAIDNRRIGDRVILVVNGATTQISMLRYTDDNNSPVSEIFPAEYGKGQLRVFASK